MVCLAQGDREAGADRLVGGVAVVVLTHELDDEAAGFERGFFAGHAKRPAVRVERELLPVPARRDHPHGRGDIEAVEFDDGLDGEVVALARCGADEQALARGVFAEATGFGRSFADGERGRQRIGRLAPRGEAAREKALGVFRLRDRGRATKHGLPHGFDRIGASAEGAGTGERPVAVSEEERLQRRRGDLPLRAAREAGGGVEHAEEFVGAVAALGGVEGAARGEVGIGGRTADGEVELARGGEHGVAHLLGIEAARRETPEEMIRGIDKRGGRGRRHARGLAVGGGEDDLAVELLEAPALRDEAPREPVEQFGVRGLVAELAEIVGRASDPAAEVILPDAVDDGAGGERVVGLGDPRSECGAAAGRVFERSNHGRLGGDEREEGGRDLALAAAAALHECGGGGARSVGRDEGLGQRGGLERVELFQL